MATETAAAEATGVGIQYAFVERAGSAPAAAAIETAIGVLKSKIGVRVGRIANHARAGASTALQAEVEVEAELNELLLSNAA